MYVISDVKDARKRMSERFDTETQEVYFAVCCAFGIVYVCYLQDRGLNSGNNPYNNCVGIIKYVGEYPDVSPFKNKK